MIKVKRLGHATVSTPDLERQIAYYTEIVGLVLIERNRNQAFLATKLGLEAIALEIGEPNCVTRLSLQVDPNGDLNEIGGVLEKAGVSVERRNNVSPGIAQAITFIDPKGTSVDIFTDYRFAADDKQQNGIMPLKLGHVAHRWSDVQKVVDFYCNVLGLRVSDWRGSDFAFLRCNSDHHSVNFVIDPVPQFHHIAFEVKDWAEIQRAAELLAKNNIRLVWGPGRHIIGHNIAIYHRNSDKLRVEFFCEMDQMKDESLGYFDPRPWHQDRPQRPKVWPADTLRNYWGFGSESIIRGYQTVD